jgi:hypothetical protein
MWGRGSHTAPSWIQPGVTLSRTRRATRRCALASKWRRCAPRATASAQAAADTARKNAAAARDTPSGDGARAVVSVATVLS